MSRIVSAKEGEGAESKTTNRFSRPEKSYLRRPKPMDSEDLDDSRSVA